jgi:hypothetical protein
MAIRNRRSRIGESARGVAAAAIILGCAGCQLVPGVGNGKLPVGKPFESREDAACYPTSEAERADRWRTGQIEFVPVRRDSSGRFYIPDERKDKRIDVCFQSTAHLVVYLVPENDARQDAWIASIRINDDKGLPPPGDEFTIDDPGLDARGGLDLADVTAAATTVCSDGLGIQGRRRHVVVFNRNTKAARYDLQICIETRDGDRQHLDPRIRNGGRAD